jgi:uncharacterized protein YjbI with pentapeptide repeats
MTSLLRFNYIKKLTQSAYMDYLYRLAMKNESLILVIMIIASSLAGCTTSDDTGTNEQNTRITDLESSQLNLAHELAEQEQTNDVLSVSISQIEAANMQAIQSLEANYQRLLSDLESSYVGAMEALILANSQTLDEINQTNAAAFDDLLLSLNSLQTNMQNSEYSINQISKIIDDFDNVDEVNRSEVEALQQSLQNLQESLQTSIYDLENRLNNTRAMNDFSYLDFQGSELFNINNGLGWQINPPIFDFANLKNASLSYSNLSDASFVNANLRGSDGLFSTFHRTDFTSASLSSGIFRQSDFTDAQFVGAQLTATEFRYSDMSGVNLTNAWIYGGGDWLMVNLSYADLTNAMMYDLDLRYANLTGADLTGAALAYLNTSYGPADLTGVTWSNTTCPDGTNSDNNGNTCMNNLSIIIT